MDDLIRRQAAIDAVTRTMVSIPTAGGKDLMYDVNRIRAEDILVIKRLPSAEPKRGKWIPCSERLPEDYTDVLVYFEYFRYGNYNRLYQTHGIGSYSAEYDSWMINHETGWRKLRVIAWMPLPKPYRIPQNETE